MEETRLDGKTKLYTGRYFADRLVNECGLIPVRMSYEPPVVPLSYELEEVARTLIPEAGLLRPGEWPQLSPGYYQQLDLTGLARIRKELCAISSRHSGRPLVLLDYEDMQKGHKSLRAVFAAWWEDQTGHAVQELTNEGEIVHYSNLHKQAKPKLPKDWTQDRRYREDVVRSWPLTHEDVEAWVEGRYWQQARTTTNPHSYSHRNWGDELMFERVVLHIREHGYEAEFGKVKYTQLDAAGHFMWTMGDPLSTTVILNRKPLPESRPRKELTLIEEATQ